MHIKLIKYHFRVVNSKWHRLFTLNNNNFSLNSILLKINLENKFSDKINKKTCML